MRIFVLLLFIINFFVFSCSPSNSSIINRTNYFSEDQPDDDYISMEATEKFADIVERHLVSVLCPAIYEGMKLDAGIYKNVLSALNRYLQKCCFYTGEVNPAVSLSKQQDLLEAMRIIPKDTENPEEDNKIVEVRMLPYFLNFTDEDGNPEKHCIEGQMVVQKLKA